jgi:S-adenosylmethionine decarboxylase
MTEIFINFQKIILLNMIGGESMLKYLGKHLILELWGCDPKALDDVEGIEKMLVDNGQNGSMNQF